MSGLQAVQKIGLEAYNAECRSIVWVEQFARTGLQQNKADEYATVLVLLRSGARLLNASVDGLTSTTTTR
jgi:hypothetical protein